MVPLKKSSMGVIKDHFYLTNNLTRHSATTISSLWGYNNKIKCLQMALINNKINKSHNLEIKLCNTGKIKLQDFHNQAYISKICKDNSTHHNQSICLNRDYSRSLQIQTAINTKVLHNNSNIYKLLMNRYNIASNMRCRFQITLLVLAK
jgi:hypothetical protein